MKLTEKQEQELNDIKLDAKRTDKNDYLIERYPVENSPLTIVSEVREAGFKEYYICMGAFRLNENSYKSLEDAEKAIDNKDWNIILGCAWVIAKSVNEINNK